MSSPSTGTGVEGRPEARIIRPLLDAAFGFFVWAAHLLIVYIATAVACQLRLGAASARARTAFLATLALVTVAAVAVVLLHGYRRYRDRRGHGTETAPEFRTSLTIG